MGTFKDRDSFNQRIESLSESIKNQAEYGNISDYLRDWADARSVFGLFKNIGPQLWEQVKTEFVPLMAGAIEFGRPDSFNLGRTLWNCVEPYKVQDKFDSRAMGDFIARMRDLTNDDWRKEQENGIYGVSAMEEHVTAYRRYREFADALKKAGITQFKLELTDHGMSAADIKQLEKVVAEVEAKIGKSKEPPPPKEPLFDAPKKGKYPKFNDAEYTQYIHDLWTRYGSALDSMTSFGGVSLVGDNGQRFKEALADFDYAAVSAILGAQKRWPPEDEYNRAGEVYEKLATLQQRFQDRFVETTNKHVQEILADSEKMLASSTGPGVRSHGFSNLRQLKQTLTLLSDMFAGCEPLSQALSTVCGVYDSHWSEVSGGPVHEKHMGEILFTSSRTLPQSADDIPETLNPAKDDIYAHVLCTQALNNISGDMLFFSCGNERFTLDVRKLKNPESAYLCLPLLPDPKDGRSPELIRFAGKMLAASGDPEFIFTTAVSPEAIGTLRIKMSKADAGKVAARVETLAAAADANRTAEAVLPDVFSKPRKTWYKDSALSKEKVAAALTSVWERRTGQPVKILAMCINHYRGEGYEWDVEMTAWQQPKARLTFSYLGMVYESGGKTYCVPDGIQLRQFFMPGKGYNDAFDVLFWSGESFSLPPEQVKRLVA